MIKNEKPSLHAMMDAARTYQRIVLWVLIIVGSGAAFALRPRSHKLPVGSNFTGYFSGLEITDGTSFLGRRYYRVRVEIDDSGFLEIHNPHGGFNEFRAYYNNGKIRATGTCYVEFLGNPTYPCPDYDRIEHGDFFTPDGVIGARIRKGSGTVTWWFQNGTKRWEAVYENFDLKRVSVWDKEGVLIRVE